MSNKAQPSAERRSSSERRSSVDLDSLKEIYKEEDNSLLFSQSIEEIIDQLVLKLKDAKKKNEEIQVYNLNAKQREAAEVLSQSGEILFYRNPSRRLCLKYNKPSMFRCLISMGCR